MQVVPDWYNLGLLEHARKRVDADGPCHRLLTHLIDGMRKELQAEAREEARKREAAGVVPDLMPAMKEFVV